ncbi:MAG: hypothetical protein WAU32_11820 [Thermoanaerobaculia bacterium]
MSTNGPLLVGALALPGGFHTEPKVSVRGEASGVKGFVLDREAERNRVRRRVASQ